MSGWLFTLNKEGEPIKSLKKIKLVRTIGIFGTVTLFSLQLGTFSSQIINNVFFFKCNIYYIVFIVHTYFVHHGSLCCTAFNISFFFSSKF